MFCSRCGSKISENVSFCENCGAPVNGTQPNYGTNANSAQNQIKGFGMSLIDLHKNLLKNYTNFKGRARRKEYWHTGLAVGIVLFVLFLLMSIPMFLFAESESVFWALAMIVPGLACLVYSIAILIPVYALTVRRLHDTGKSAWFLLLGLIPYVGSFILLILTVLDSQPGANQYGPNPKM